MTKNCRKICFSIAAVVLIAFLSGPALADSIFGDEWEKFFEEKVSFGGFAENTSGCIGQSRQPFFQHVEPFRHGKIYHSARIQRRNGGLGKFFYLLAFR